MNFDNIATLARNGSKPVDEFNTDNLSDEIREALKEAVADERKTTAKAAAIEIMSVVTQSRAKKAALVQEIRALRLKEKEIKAVLAKIEMSERYATASSNYMPLADSIGLPIPSVNRRRDLDLFKIPQEFADPKADSDIA